MGSTITRPWKRWIPACWPTTCSRLIAGEEVQLPQYNFKEGKSDPGEVVKLRKEQLIILEGIHGLDPRLLPDIPADQTYRHVLFLPDPAEP